MKSKSQIRSLLLGGVLPVIAFTLIEEWKGPLWGTVAGLGFGALEIIYEWRKEGKVSAITWIANGMIFGLGLISVFTQDGIWFKLQPALLVLGMAFVFWGTSFLGRPLLIELAQKQNQNLPPLAIEFMKTLNVRLGFFFVGLSALSVYAAFYWSTTEWAALKGVGSPLLMIAYLVLEILWFRFRDGSAKNLDKPQSPKEMTEP